MKVSVFDSMVRYTRDVYERVRSVWASSMTAVPYLFSTGEFRKEITEQYPDPISARTAEDLPPRTRGLLFNDIERCTGCKECEMSCPTKCIHVETEPGADENKIWVATFDIDFSKCIFCGLCTEVCQPQSLTHTKQYEGAVFEPSGMVAHFGRGQVTQEQRDKWVLLRQQSKDEDAFI